MIEVFENVASIYNMVMNPCQGSGQPFPHGLVPSFLNNPKCRKYFDHDAWSTPSALFLLYSENPGPTIIHRATSQSCNDYCILKFRSIL